MKNSKQDGKIGEEAWETRASARPPGLLLVSRGADAASLLKRSPGRAPKKPLFQMETKLEGVERADPQRR